MRAVRIRPLGPTHYGTRPLSTPGTVTRDDVWIVPQPSTLLGALGYLAGVKIDCPGKGPEGALAALREVAKALGVRRVWGPLAVVRRGSEVLVGAAAEGWIKTHMWAPRERGEAAGGVPVAKFSRIGLMLTEHKTAAQGYLYRATYYAPVEAVYFIDADVVPTGLVRLGGEGRLAAVEADPELRPDPYLPPKSGAAVLLTPLLMPEGELPSCIRAVRGLEQPGEEPKVKVVQWGLGFSEVCRERRPMYPALPPGTEVEVENCDQSQFFLGELGYGALARLP
ncbi:type III-B CRISPR module-associated Cmr3 family protein [Pyrobaculum calidifontis]|uniref:CRISPR-associated protein, Cmr3 family n=1 Tax=Pyrobaculum calidifontis (strain DSM 21063 / JCM 11548 / VA1) TaxID=410359 RepID=A3MVP0_PYRCJ|nr:type III-B CRISPR module-associated Cmr3 family protein [Pyrobaculum calidifontis]ABO08707.1 hypothetical protein Pcal_1283 [Pyrobaculum calidifontis JCM 11548]